MAFLSLAMLVACGRAVGTTSTTSAVVAPHAAQRLLVDAAACWLGGISGDLHAETPASASGHRTSGATRSWSRSSERATDSVTSSFERLIR